MSRPPSYKALLIALASVATGVVLSTAGLVAAIALVYSVGLTAGALRHAGSLRAKERRRRERSGSFVRPDGRLVLAWRKPVHGRPRVSRDPHASDSDSNV